MIAREKCPDCGTSFTAGDEATVAKLLTEHADKQHGSLEQKHSKVLGDAMSAFFVIGSGGKITTAEAKGLHNAIAELLAKPKVPIEQSETEQEPPPSDSGS